MIFAYAVIPLFVVLLFTQIESTRARIILVAIVAGLWVLWGAPAAAVAATIFSIGTLIAARMPWISKY